MTLTRFDPFDRRLLLAVWLLLATLLLWPIVALADVPGEVAMPAQSLLGQLMQGALGLAGAALVALVPWVFRLLSATTTNAALKGVMQVLELKVSAAVRHGEEVLRPMLQKALADGTLDDLEKKQLKAQVLHLVREGAADELHALSARFGFAGPFLEHLLSDLVEKAVMRLSDPAVPGTITPIEQLA